MGSSRALECHRARSDGCERRRPADARAEQRRRRSTARGGCLAMDGAEVRHCVGEVGGLKTVWSPSGSLSAPSRMRTRACANEGLRVHAIKERSELTVITLTGRSLGPSRWWSLHWSIGAWPRLLSERSKPHRSAAAAAAGAAGVARRRHRWHRRCRRALAVRCMYQRRRAPPRREVEKRSSAAWPPLLPAWTSTCAARCARWSRGDPQATRSAASMHATQTHASLLRLGAWHRCWARARSARRCW